MINSTGNKGRQMRKSTCAVLKCVCVCVCVSETVCDLKSSSPLSITFPLKYLCMLKACITSVVDAVDSPRTLNERYAGVKLLLFFTTLWAHYSLRPSASKWCTPQQTGLSNTSSCSIDHRSLALRRNPKSCEVVYHIVFYLFIYKQTEGPNGH